MVSPQPPAFSCRFRRSTKSVIAVPVYKSRAYSRAGRRCLPPRSPHGSAANWSFQGRAHATQALEARPIHVIGGLGALGSHGDGLGMTNLRSEEDTSELQSPMYVV